MRWRRVYLALTATTAATLLLELALTRLFSVVLFYHFAFMAISIALFGLGAGGVLSYALGGSTPQAPWRRLGMLCAANAAATAGALLVVLSQPVKVEITAESALRLVLLYFISAIPFALAGAAIATAVAASLERVNRIYFFDLLGAAGGCLLLVPLLDWLGGPGTVLAAGALYAAAGAAWESAAEERRRSVALLYGAAAAALGVFSVVNAGAKWVDVRMAKGLRQEYEVFSQWNSFSRVAVKHPSNSEPVIILDADAGTVIPGFAPEQLGEDARRRLLQSGDGLPYRLRPGAKTLVIGPGGGYDMVRALASGSRSVTGVEINPIIVNEVMKKRFAAYSHNLYRRPEVSIEVEDGRSFVRRSKERYQVIQMTLVDTWASTAAGAFALSENNLYTVEAFVDYLEHLSEDGLLAVTRWEFEPPRESLRVVSLGLEALRRLGARDARRHFIICRQKAEDVRGYGALDTVLVKRTPFTDEEVRTAGGAIREGHLKAVYLPGEGIANAFTELLEARDPARFAREYRYDISPVTDNRPFFFFTVRAGELWRFITGASEDVKVNMGVMVLFAALGASAVATALILLLPPVVLGTRLPRQSGAWRQLLYFVAIGLGFILVEVALIQKLALFLGRPTYSLTVVVFSLLVGSGAGSYASKRLIGEDDGRLRAALAAIIVVVGGLSAGVGWLVEAGAGWTVAAKCLATAAVLTPAAIPMGMAFPTGLGRLGRRYPEAVRWAWATNSAASVLGSVGAMFVAIQVGLAETLWAGAGCYLVALWSLRSARTTRNF